MNIKVELYIYSFDHIVKEYKILKYNNNIPSMHVYNFDTNAPPGIEELHRDSIIDTAVDLASKITSLSSEWLVLSIIDASIINGECIITYKCEIPNQTILPSESKWDNIDLGDLWIINT